MDLTLSIITLAVDYPQDELNILFIAFFIIIAILLVRLVYRWFTIYSKNKPLDSTAEPEITLKKIPSPKFKLMVGGTYLVFERTEKDRGKGFKIFKDELRNEDPGLLITRTYPEKILKKYDLGTLPVIWLSRSENKDSIKPTNLGTIVEEIKEFTDQNECSIVMFDGLEYLTIHNEFERVLKFLHSMKDEIAVNNSRLIITFNPKTLDKKKIALLSNDLKILSKSKSSS